MLNNFHDSSLAAAGTEKAQRTGILQFINTKSTRRGYKKTIFNHKEIIIRRRKIGSERELVVSRAANRLIVYPVTDRPTHRNIVWAYHGSHP